MTPLAGSSNPQGHTDRRDGRGSARRVGAAGKMPCQRFPNHMKEICALKTSVCLEPVFRALLAFIFRAFNIENRTLNWIMI